MLIKTTNRYIDQDIKNKANASVVKGARVTVNISENGRIYADCKAFGRKLGEIIFEKKNDIYVAVQKNTTEKDFYPLENIIIEVCKVLVKKKVKVIKY